MFGSNLSEVFVTITKTILKGDMDTQALLSTSPCLEPTLP